MRVNHHKINKTIALAGVFQAAFLVHQIAFNRTYNEKAFLNSIESIMKIDIPDVQGLFGHPENIKIALSYLAAYGENSAPQKEEKLLIKYLTGMTKLAKRILLDKNMSMRMQRRLDIIISQANHLGTLHDIVIDEIAGLYQQTFLSAGLSIPVLGRKSCLKNEKTVHKIHALLLAGIRSGVLWYQVGGSQFELLFLLSRSKKYASMLLNNE